MALSPSGGGEEGYSSLREAVNRIMGSAPGGASQQQSGNLGWTGAGSGAPQTSDVILGQKTGLSTGGAVENTPFEDPNVTAQKQAVSDAQAVTAGMQSQLNSLATPAAATTAAAAKAPVSTAPAPQQMVSKAALYELQKQHQMADYEASKAQQIAKLQATGLYRPDQLNFAPTNWGAAMKPADWGKQTNYMNTTMVANPYAK